MSLPLTGNGHACLTKCRVEQPRQWEGPDIVPESSIINPTVCHISRRPSLHEDSLLLIAMKSITLAAALSCLVLRVVAQAQVWGQCGGVGW